LDQPSKFVADASTDSSVSTKQESTVKKLNLQDTVEENESLALDTQKDTKDLVEKKENLVDVKKERKDTSSDSSDTEDEKKDVNVSSSDYDSSVHAHPKGKRPESFVSDTSSDYDSLSDVGKRRPQSFLLDDEYEVIAEEDAVENESKISDGNRKSPLLSSDSEGPVHARQENKSSTSAPSEIATPRTTEILNLAPSVPVSFQEEEGDDNDEVVTDLDGISSRPDPFPSSLSSTLDLHAEQSSVSVDVACSTVNSSNTLEGIDPLVNDLEKGAVSPTCVLPGLDNSNPLDFEGTSLCKIAMHL
jgi:hypothetical protein